MKFSISINIAIFGKVAGGYTHYFSTFWKCPARDHTNWNTLTVLQENLNPNPIPNLIECARKSLARMARTSPIIKSVISDHKNLAHIKENESTLDIINKSI